MKSYVAFQCINYTLLIFIIFPISSCTTNYYLPSEGISPSEENNLNNALDSNSEAPFTKSQTIKNNYYGFTEKEVDEIINDTEFFLPHLLRVTLGRNRKGSIKYKKILRAQGYNQLGSSHIETFGPYETSINTFGRTNLEKGYVEIFQFSEISEGERTSSPIFGRSFCSNSDEKLSVFWDEIFRLFTKQGGEPENKEGYRSLVNHNNYYKWEFLSQGKDNDKGTTELSRINNKCFSIISCKLELIEKAQCEKFKLTFEKMVKRFMDSITGSEDRKI